MPIPNENLTLADLVRPLSYEALEYFASGEIIAFRANEDVLTCKFVRVGEVMIIGSSITYGVPDMGGKRRFLLHQDLLDELPHYPDLHAMAAATPAEQLPLQGLLSDAGFARIMLGNSVSELVLKDDSDNFSRAKNKGRQISATIARRLVGNTVEVICKDDPLWNDE